jgi:hypothetical protein
MHDGVRRQWYQLRVMAHIKREFVCEGCGRERTFQA